MTQSREYPSAPIVGVGAVIIENARVLLVRRGQPPLLGQWSVPGGAVELGETLEEAIVREVREETGLTVIPTALLKTIERIDRDDEGRVRFHYVLVDFLCRVAPEQGTLTAATDVSEAEWVPLEMLRLQNQIILPEFTLEVIEQGQRQIQESERAASSF